MDPIGLSIGGKMPLTQFDERVGRSQAAAFDNSYTPGSFFSLIVSLPDTRIDQIRLSNSDVAAQTITLAYINFSPPAIVGSVTIAPGVGVAGSANLELLAAIDAALGQTGIVVATQNQLGVSLAAAPTTGVVTVLTIGGDF